MNCFLSFEKLNLKKKTKFKQNYIFISKKTKLHTKNKKFENL